jgi:catechol 2,3-dioxygenase-like lactoylglutathione lyase family enzyme
MLPEAIPFREHVGTMKLEQIDHLAITCRSPDASRDWYIRVLGFEHVHAGLWDGIPIFLKLGSTFVALFPARDAAAQPSNTAPRLEHFALRAGTQADFREAQAQLAALGISFNFQDHRIAHSVYFADPDGHTVEITTYDVR